MVMGVDQFWIYLNDQYSELRRDSPAVADYLELPDVAERVSVIPYEWIDYNYTERNMFRKYRLRSPAIFQTFHGTKKHVFLID